MNVEKRSRVHAALGDPHRLQIADALALGDRSFDELAHLTALLSNLLAHHLQVLEAAELIERHTSEGDRRRKYISLRRDAVVDLLPHSLQPIRSLVFVCTHNSARSQYAAALWTKHTGQLAQSVGSHPAARVNPTAVVVAAQLGIDLSLAVPTGYDTVQGSPDLVVSVCDRAREAGIPFGHAALHWSVPDPVLRNTKGAFKQAFDLITERIEVLAANAGVEAAR